MNNKSETKKEITLDDLASMVQNGFTELKSEFKSDIKLLEEKMVKEVKEVKSDTEEIKAELNKKVDRFEHKSLEYRVEKLEKKFA